MNTKYVFRVADTPFIRSSGGRQSYPLILPKDTNIQGIAVGYHELYPGGEGGPLHTHTEQETFFFIKGEGFLIIDDASYSVGPNTAAYAPAGTPHRIINSGTETLCFVWIFCPPRTDQQ